MKPAYFRKSNISLRLQLYQITIRYKKIVFCINITTFPNEKNKFKPYSFHVSI